MFFKTSRSNGKLAYIAETPPLFTQPDHGIGLRDVHSGMSVIKLAEAVRIDPNQNFYLQNWAVSALEKWGYNDNFDAFETDELKKSFKTFVGSWTCVDHENSHANLAIGENIDAVYMPDDYVQIVMSVNKKKAEARRPGLEKKIATGQITDTSMGCLARESVCSICDNVAFDETQYCDDIRQHRGQKVCNASTNWVEKVAFEKNRGVVFFEDSIITDSEGADRNAKIIAKIAQFNPHAMAGPKSISAEKFYILVRDMAKKASREEKAFLIHLLDGVSSIID